jgi:hypothetical protein
LVQANNQRVIFDKQYFGHGTSFFTSAYSSV